MLARLAPADLVLVEGFKRERHPKIEVRGASAEPMDVTRAQHRSDRRRRRAGRSGLPWFRRDDIAAIADFIAGRKG